MNMPRLSNLRVGRRLGIAFGAVGALVLVSAGAGLSAVGEQRDLAEQLSAVDSILADSGTARFQIADVTGWQGLVLADVAAYGPEVALAADAYNRSGMLEAKQGVYDWLDAVDTSAMSRKERDAFDQLRPAWDNYFHWDDQVVAWLSEGTHESYVATMESINGGEAGEGYGIVLDLADAIQASAKERAAQLRVDQDRAQTRATVLLSVVGALAVVLAAMLALLAARSVVRPLRRVKAALEGRS